MKNTLLLAVAMLLMDFPFRILAQGYSVWGGLYVPPDLTNAIDVSVFSEQGTTAAVTSTGQVRVFFDELDGGAIIPGITNAVAIDDGFVRKADGTYCSIPGGLPVPELNDAVDVSAGIFYTCSIRSDGTIGPEGFRWRLPQNALEITNAIQVAVGKEDVYVLTSGGTVMRIRPNGLSGVWVPGITNAISIDSGMLDAVAAVLEDGRAFYNGTVLSLSNVVQVEVAGHSFYALKANGQVATTTSTLDLPFAVKIAGHWAGHLRALVIPNVAAVPPTVPGPPTPPSRTASVGSTVLFNIVALGVGSFQYQWYHGSTALAGQTNRFLLLSNVQPSDSGTYWVEVSNQAGTTPSASAYLNVGSSLEAQIVPRLTMLGVIGANYRVEAIDAIGPTNAWKLLDTITITNNPQFYYDDQAIGRPQQFYRLVLTNSP